MIQYAFVGARYTAQVKLEDFVVNKVKLPSPLGDSERWFNFHFEQPQKIKRELTLHSAKENVYSCS
jgi:hypothetical protein